jgi:tetratricopeptide (TPR) repeat protein
MAKRKTNEQPAEVAETVEIKTRLLENPEIHIIALIVIGLLAYSNTFNVPFLFDDEGSIQLNQGVHGISNFLNGGYNFLPNRVIGYLSFALNYEFSALKVTSYHIVNLAIHLIATQLVYALTRLTLSTPRLKRVFSESQIGLFAFVVALLFVSHPVQTQAVTYIVQRLTSLTTLFYLGAVVCYIRWRLDYSETTPFVRGIASPWYAVALIAAVLAMKTKEIAFTLPLIILLYEYSFFGWPRRKLLGQLTPLLLTVAIIPYTVYSTINPLLQSGGSLLSDVTAPAYSVVKVTRWEYLYTQFSVILTYLRLLILPINQNLDYDYPMNHSLAEPRTILSLLALLLLFSLTVYLFVKSTIIKEESGDLPTAENTGSTAPLYRLAAFGIFWFFITLSVESSIITIRDVIFEHRLYLPSCGFFLSVSALGAAGLMRLERTHMNMNKITLPLVAACILVLTGTTFARNSVWGDWISIWSDAVAKSPDKPRTHNVLGIGYFYRLKFDEAMREYQEAVRLKPDFIEAYYNMGLIYKEQKNYVEALSMFLKVTSISAFDAAQFSKTYNEIGICYAEMGQSDQAIEALASAVKISPDSTEFRNNYAFALRTSGNLQEALKEYQAVLALDPANSYASMAVIEINSMKANGAGK